MKGFCKLFFEILRNLCYNPAIKKINYFMLEIKIKKRISFLLSFALVANVILPSIDAYWAPSDIGIINNLHTNYDWSEWLSYWSFKVKDTLLEKNWSFYYENTWHSEWKIWLAKDDSFHWKMARITTSSWYVWVVSWIWKYSFDNIFPKFSAWTNDINSQYPHHFNWATEILEYTAQTSTWYWLWLDRKWIFNWKVQNEYWYWEADGSASSAWRPMPFDSDWDWLYDKKESWFMPWASVNKSNWEWDVDWDWWSDNEELLFWTNPNLIGDFPVEAVELWVWSYISQLYYDKFLDWAVCVAWEWKWTSEDCDGDGISNREEQWNWTNPTVVDTDWDWLTDYIEILFGMNPNNPYDFNQDFDNDWIPNYVELSWASVTVNYIDIDWNNATYDYDLYLDIWNADTDHDWISDSNEWLNYWTNPLYWDSDFDTIGDWVETSLSILDWTGNIDKYWYDLSWSWWITEDKDILPSGFEDDYRKWWVAPVIKQMIYTATWIKAWDADITVFLDDKYELDWLNPDSNWDEIYDWNEDFDNDWLTNYEEYFYWYNPNNWDTDWDWISDGDESESWLFPLWKINPWKDVDNDWIINRDELSWIWIRTKNCIWVLWAEFTVFLDPYSNDTDNDWIKDKDEIRLNLDPTDPDTDWDGILDWIEFSLWSDANCNTSTLNDTDWDGLYDVFENKYTNWVWTYTYSWWVLRTGYLELENSMPSASWNSYDLNSGNVNSDWNIWSDAFEDFDWDWLTNFEEQVKWTDPYDWDTDNDWINDYLDDTINVWVIQCDDFDNDALCDIFEAYYTEWKNNTWYVFPLVWTWIFVEWDEDFSLKYNDRDSNDISDFWLIPDRLEDFDWDWLINWEEQRFWTDPNNADTDWDWIDDKTEIEDWWDYLTCIWDIDAISWQVWTYNCSIDMDHDWIPNKDEIFWWMTNNAWGSQFWVTFFTNYLIYDNDWDGLSDWHEKWLWIDPLYYDTDWDWWYDWIETTVWFIETYLDNWVKWNPWLSNWFSWTWDPDDNTKFPLDSNWDNMADVWENYFINIWIPETPTFVNPASYDWDLAKYKDSDGDGLSDWIEMLYWTNPLINKNRMWIINNPLSSIWCEGLWTNTWMNISVISSLNMINEDIYNSGFWEYAVRPSYASWSYLLPNSEVFDELTWFSWSNLEEFRNSEKYFVNLDQTWSNLSGSLISSLTYTWNLIPIWVNAFSVDNHRDSYFPHSWFRIIDYRFWKAWDDFQLVYYLWDSCIDTISPVCSAILHWWNHEQRIATWNEYDWWNDWSSSWTILSLTWSTSDVGIYTGVVLASILPFWDTHHYTWNLVTSGTWYIPWDTSYLSYNQLYKDNISGLKTATWSLYDQSDLTTALQSWNLKTFNWELVSNVTDYPLCDNDLFVNCNNSTEFNNKIVKIIISDMAWNTGSCISQTTKVDVDAPVVKIHSITHSETGNADEITRWTVFASFYPKDWNTMDISLTDNKPYSWTWVYKYDLDSETNLLNGVSSFRPIDFNLWKLYYCWPWHNARDDCLVDFEWWILTEAELDTKYLYRWTWANLTYAWSDLQNHFTSTWVFFMKDAYFVNTWVIVNDLAARDIVTWTWAEQQVLVTKSSWSYLTTWTWFFKVWAWYDLPFVKISDFNSTWFVATDYINWWEYNSTTSWAMLNWRVAFKVFNSNGVVLDSNDYFFFKFDFQDRAWNAVTRYSWLKTRDNVYIKILGNLISSDNEVETFDENVQEFYQKDSKVSSVINWVKQNLRHLFWKAIEAVSSGAVVVRNIGDLSQYKINVWWEDIYIVKNWDIILWENWTWTLTLTTGTWSRPITILAYWWNIFLNSRYIETNKNTAIVALVDPLLSLPLPPDNKPREAQWNIFINPDLLVWRWQLIAESSIISFAKIEDRLEIVLNATLRNVIFANQLIWDGAFTSNNSVWWYFNRTCPVSLYWYWNLCDITDVALWGDIARVYDLHFLRMFDDDSWILEINQDDIILPSQIGSWHILYNTLSWINEKMDPSLKSLFRNYEDWIEYGSIKTILEVDSLGVPATLKWIVKSVQKYYNRRVILKHSIPEKSMQIFNN